MYTTLLPNTAKGMRSRHSLNTTVPESWPAAIRFCVLCAVMVQKRSRVRTKDCTHTRLVLSHTRMLWSSLSLRIRSSRGWKSTQLTLPVWPRSVSTSHAFVSFVRQILIMRSSEPETISGSSGWKEAQFTPRSWPSSTYFTVATESMPRRPMTLLMPGFMPGTAFFCCFNPEMSQTRMVWSREADTMRSSCGWN